jgi:hypothetical protein
MADLSAIVDAAQPKAGKRGQQEAGSSVTRESTSAAFQKRIRGSTMVAVRKRMASARPFEDAFTGNLQRKLACGALRPEIADRIRAELACRGEQENSI